QSNSSLNNTKSNKRQFSTDLIRNRTAAIYSTNPLFCCLISLLALLFLIIFFSLLGPRFGHMGSCTGCGRFVFYFLFYFNFFFFYFSNYFFTGLRSNTDCGRFVFIFIFIFCLFRFLIILFFFTDFWLGHIGVLHNHFSNFFFSLWFFRSVVQINF